MTGSPDRTARPDGPPAPSASHAPDAMSSPLVPKTGMSLHYYAPDAGIAESITGYHLYATGADRLGQSDWFLPGTANVRVTLDAGPLSVSIGERRFDPLPQVALFGPTSRAMHAITNGGAMIGFGISALGWGRLFRTPAAAYANRIVALETVLPRSFSVDLIAMLSALPDGAAIPLALDAFLAERLGPVPAEAEAIRAVMAMVVDAAPCSVAAMAARIGVTPDMLRRLTTHHFGFPPKTLLLRARFLRSFLRVFQAGLDGDYSTIDPSYHGPSHFLRDADIFLGMTPRRFLAQSTPFLSGSVRARPAVFGSATQALHDPTVPLPTSPPAAT